MYTQLETGINGFATDDDRYTDRRYVDLGRNKKDKFLTISTSVSLLYYPNPSYRLNLSIAYSPKVKRGGYGDLDSLPPHLKMRFPLIGVFDFDCDRPEQVTTPFGALPRYIIGSDDKLYTIQNYYFLNFQGQAVKVEEVSQAQGENQTLEEALNDFGDEGDIVRVSFSPRRNGKGSWSVVVDLRGGDLEKLGFLASEIENGQFKKVTLQDLGLRSDFQD
ncbi:MAG: hypothetical protein Q7R97_02255 [Candidatus Daviesbacteria bacterium]|nr:hypothetical protein [Candidatus Daviesbacteria bacterium]